MHNVQVDDIGLTPDGRIGLITEVDIKSNIVYAEMEDTHKIEAFDYGKAFYVECPNKYTLTVTFESVDPEHIVKSDVIAALESIPTITIFDYDLK